MKKKTNLWFWLIAAVIVFYLVYKPSLSFLGSTTSTTTNTVTTTTIQRLESTPSASSCSLSITPTTIISGERLTGTITDGRNAFCEGYGKMVGTNDWRKIWEGRTDITGTATYSDNLIVTGDFLFAVICDSNGNGALDAQDCVTNQVSVKVNPSTTPSPDCTDTDGKNKLTPGMVTSGGLMYTDDCAGNWAVKEYYCNGNIMSEQVIGCDAGYICFETRSGDYCKIIAEPEPEYTCFDSDGGINFNVIGNCQDSFHHLGYSDGCENGYLKEYYCDDNNICQSIFGGRCDQIACSAIVNPVSQTSCDAGYCSSGTCTFIPATLVTRSRCAC